MKNIKELSIVALVLFVCCLLFVATSPNDSTEKFFQNSKFEENDNFVFYGFFYSMIGVSLHINEDEFRDICLKDLHLSDDFEKLQRCTIQLPVYSGIQEVSDYKGYSWQRFRLSGDFIKKTKQIDGEYYLNAVYNRSTGIAFFYLIYI